MTLNKLKQRSVKKLQQGKTMKLLSLTLIAAMTLSTFTAAAQTAAEKGLLISKQAKEKDLGWVDTTADMLMTLKNTQGQQSVREIKIKSLEVSGDGDKSLTIFNKPRDVKGTAFLSFSHTDKADDQWLYLPALKRVKRISSRNKSGPFMGSEFAFEDLSSFEVEKFTYKYLAEENLNGLVSHKIEQYPTDKSSGYTRRIVWIDKEHLRTLKVDFYDRKDSLLKTLEFNDYQLFLGTYWRALSQVMTNHQTGKSTELTWNNYEFKTGLKSSDFNRNALKRAR